MQVVIGHAFLPLQISRAEHGRIVQRLEGKIAELEAGLVGSRSDKEAAAVWHDKFASVEDKYNILGRENRELDARCAGLEDKCNLLTRENRDLEAKLNQAVRENREIETGLARETRDFEARHNQLMRDTRELEAKCAQMATENRNLDAELQRLLESSKQKISALHAKNEELAVERDHLASEACCLLALHNQTSAGRRRMRQCRVQKNHFLSCGARCSNSPKLHCTPRGGGQARSLYATPPSPTPRVLKDSGAGAMAPTVP